MQIQIQIQIHKKESIVISRICLGVMSFDRALFQSPNFNLTFLYRATLKNFTLGFSLKFFLGVSMHLQDSGKNFEKKSQCKIFHGRPISESHALFGFLLLLVFGLFWAGIYDFQLFKKKVIKINGVPDHVTNFQPISIILDF